MRIRAGFHENAILKALVVFYGTVWIVTAIQPVYRSDWLLENILVLLFVPLLIGTYRLLPLSDLSYVLITFFMVLHAIGAHYTYTEVPLGYWMKDIFHLGRNHFDRIVHGSFGLLMAYPVREVFLRVASARGFWAYYLPLDVTLAFSAAYEIVEMLIAKIVDPGAGDAYLGTQGDIWDAQMDMSCAAAGAILCMIITALLRKRFHRNHAILGA